ncbi:aldo/keto reductase [Mycolicibacterium sp. CBMA 226]|uniref:aldo/keto reductase n=1 Tax=Mycolicibacterium sp. CBMA 226 TaxID=2606611 RepID=UPI0012DC88D1|nr:aldo/keto reductase [Mycolicibacterium sp. CBMA 226]MUL74944.1 aldo/keto reductase [Mycolicibacterium sp. CBMA 226]
MGLRGKFRQGPLGLGTASLGSMFRDVSDDDAAASLDAAWDLGTRYFDTAPFYGAGLAEFRLGTMLSRHQRDEYVLSTKVGRLIQSDGAGRRHNVVFDYTELGSMKSIEDSLVRLGVDRLDFIWVHDVAQDFHGDGWLAQFEIARTGAFRALTKLRGEGVIRGWGLCVNRIEPIELLLGLTQSNPDGSVLAERYTLLDHKPALRRIMPAAQQQGVDIIVDGPYSSGILSGRSLFDYHRTSTEITAKVARITSLADQYEVPVKAAALQFCLAHPAVVAVISGASTPAKIAEDHAALATPIPNAFWHDLREQQLVAPDAPLPIDRAEPT